jgi:uncharacterized metal-binding protein
VHPTNKTVTAKLVAVSGAPPIDALASIAGISKCLPDDGFDKDLGIKLAIDRCVVKCARHMIKGFDKDKQNTLELMQAGLSDLKHDSTEKIVNEIKASCSIRLVRRNANKNK